MRVRSILTAVAMWSLAGVSAASAEAIKWQAWTPDLFQRSAAEHKLVILDLEAVWCHWCHVMDATTYADPLIAKLIGEHFIAVKVDQDANPDLASRYGDWGWPATILYAEDGTEIAKLRGYYAPDQFQSILSAFIAEPTPGPSAEAAQKVTPAASMFLNAVQRAGLHQRWLEVYDQTNGGWGEIQKFIHAGSMDYALALAETGDAEATRMARQTLDASLKLIDPVWGGIYQYSDKPDWSSPHFEKIMPFQAQVLRQYAHAARLFGDPAYRRAADDIARYLMTGMRGAEGAFYVSQDADVSAAVTGHDFYAQDAAGRAKLGMPRIDTNLYARENGLAIGALAAYANATGDQAALAAAVKAAQWVQANRRIEGGGFSHGAADRSGPYLADTLAMGAAMLDLYAATGERAWLKAAGEAGDFIESRFHDRAGFATAETGETTTGALAAPALQIEENIDAARFFNLLARYQGEPRFRAAAGHAMKALASEQVLGSRRFLAGVLVADSELAIEPVHLTIVGHRDDVKAQSLHAAAAAYPALYRRLDWWDTREGPLANPDVQYPEMDQAAAFACSNQICSRPVFDAAGLEATVKAMMALRVTARE